MVLRLLFALLFMVVVVVGSSAVVYRGWQINNPGAPMLDVKGLVESPEQVTAFVKKLSNDDIVAAVIAVFTGEPQGKAQAVAKADASKPAPVVAAVAAVPAPVKVEPVKSSKVAVAPPPVVAPIEPATQLRVATGLTPAQKGCVFGGAAGTGAALVVGPAEVAAFATGAASAVPATARLVGTVIGAALVTGCATGYLVAPSLDW